ncbi:MAG: OmpA family protein [Spirochaetes bacterium]|jgi:outer membrane protein OmpA-like peptidoglycan-associated protein|nr:OmpA family protein [Spirochaetota bacterium]
MKRLFLLLLFFSFSLFAAPVTLQWKLNEGDRIEVLKTAEVQSFINAKTNAVYSERNIIDLTCKKDNGNLFNVNGTFAVFTKIKNESVFKRTDISSSSFWIQNNGVFKVSKEFLMPNLRHIPSFPTKPVNVGDKWNMEGEIIIDSLSIPFSITMPVHYTLNKIEDEKSVKIAYIEYSYLINQDIKPGTVPEDFPVQIKGRDTGIIKWDITHNRPLDFFNKYHVVFIFNHDRMVTTYEWKMNVDTKHTVYPYITPKEKTVKKEELDKEIDNENITVEENEKGLVIRMGEVLFAFDSADLKPETQKTLSDILNLIKAKYPDREIIVEGHTDNTGNPHYNQSLSEKRASNVASVIINGVDHDKVSYIGHGEKFPIEKNNTAEGRKKNRRVDIIIKLN